MGRVAHRLGACLALAVLGAGAGCNILGPAVVIAHGPPRQKPLTKLERTRPTLVFVDDRSNRLPRPALRQSIADEATRILLKEDMLRNAIEPRAAYVVVAADKAGQVTSIVDTARAASAEVVVYVSVDSFVLSTDGQRFAPEASMRVKVLDETKPEPRVWPQEREGTPIRAAMRTTAQALPATLSEIAVAEEALARQCGKAVAQVFYEHPVSDAAAQGR